MTDFTLVTSSQNAHYKWLKKLALKKHRDREGVFILEGRRLVHHALSLGIVPELIVINSEHVHFEALEDNFVNHPVLLAAKGPRVIQLLDSLYQEVADVVHSQGVIAVVAQSALEQVATLPSKHVVVLDQVQDPGNLGTIIRTCDALGVHDIYLMKGTCDPYSAKVLRATMGSIFSVRLHQHQEPEDLAKNLKGQGFLIAATALENSVALGQLPLDKPLALCFGNEGNGVSPQMLDQCDLAIRIPMMGHAESLNVGIACGIVVYHAMSPLLNA